MNREILINAAYIVASILFIVGLKMLGRQATARRGNLVSGIGMLIAIVATLVDRQVVSYTWIAAGLVAGTAIGLMCAYLVKMTAMPEMVALLNGLGGLASLIVGAAEFMRIRIGEVTPEHPAFTSIAIFFTVVIATAMVAATLAPLVMEQVATWVPYATSVAGLGATYLSGRAIVIYLRTRS